MPKSPYLKANRLGYVIAAITALAKYRYYKLSIKKAAERIDNQTLSEEEWLQIFKDHPEFFRLVKNKQAEQMVSLIWRRQKPKLYDATHHKLISRDQFDTLSNDQKKSISREPLSSDDTTALINIAINLHNQAINSQNSNRWWLPLMTAILTSVLVLITSNFTKIVEMLSLSLH